MFILVYFFFFIYFTCIYIFFIFDFYDNSFIFVVCLSIHWGIPPGGGGGWDLGGLHIFVINIGHTVFVKN